MSIFDVGKACVALIATCVTDCATRSCFDLRSFVPTCMMIVAGITKFFSDKLLKGTLCVRAPKF